MTCFELDEHVHELSLWPSRVIHEHFSLLHLKLEIRCVEVRLSDQVDKVIFVLRSHLDLRSPGRMKRGHSYAWHSVSKHETKVSLAKT